MAASTPAFNSDHYAMTYDPAKKVLTITVDLSENGVTLPVMSSTGKSVIVANTHSFQPIDPTFKVSMTVIRKETPEDRLKVQAAALGANTNGSVVGANS